MLLRRGLEHTSGLEAAIRAAATADLRLDGRALRERRTLSVELGRDGAHSEVTAAVRWGRVLVHCTVTAALVKPFSDRPTEGSFSVHCADPVVHALLDKALRSSDCLDLESLCVVAGERVWSVQCSVRVLGQRQQSDAGDACLLAATAALRAFRKPEASVVREGGVASLRLHAEDDRDPLPLALHYSPLAVTVAVCLREDAASEGEPEEPLLLLDPSAEEAELLDARLIFAVNAHSEVCLCVKPGGASLRAAAVGAAAALAVSAAAELHLVMEEALAALEARVVGERETRLQLLRAVRREEDFEGVAGAGEGGIDRDDPLLAWSLLHQASLKVE